MYTQPLETNRQRSSVMYSQSIKDVLHAACVYLSSRCDGAREQDGQGFNRYDTSFGTSLASVEPKYWSSKQVEAAHKMLLRYRTQLRSAGIQIPNLESGQRDIPLRAPKSKSININGDVCTITFDYDPQLVTFMNTIPGSRYNRDEKSWTIHVRTLGDYTEEFMERGFVIDNNKITVAIQTVVAAEEKSIESSHAETTTFKANNLKLNPYPFQQSGIEYILLKKKVLVGDAPGCVDGKAIVQIFRGGKEFEMTLARLCLWFHRWSETTPIYCKAMAGDEIRYNKIVNVVYTGEQQTLLIETHGGKSIKVTPDHEIATPHGWIAAQNLSNGSAVVVQHEEHEDMHTTDTVKSITLGGVREVYDLVMADPYRNFVANGIVVHNCGKTIQAMGAIAHASLLPAVVIAPASVKYNWAKEVSTWTTLTTHVITGTKVYPLPQANVYILNYDLVHAWGETLRALNPQCVVADEVHYCKSSKARRTKAVKEVFKNVPYAILLSGTPALNAPHELAHPLTLIDGLKGFGGYKKFVHEFCGGFINRWGGLDYNASNIKSQDIVRILRSTCMIRRLKENVLKDLPPKSFNEVSFEIDNRKEYQRASSNVVKYLGELAAKSEEFQKEIAHLPEEERIEKEKERRASKEAKVARAEALAMIEALKQVAVRGKLEGVREWITNHVSSGEKLVVFASHIDIQKSLFEFAEGESWKPCHVFGEDDAQERQSQVMRFQNDNACRVIICSIGAGGEGITLTAASHLAFVEYPWTPGKYDQCSDRIHRIGQNYPVTIWNLVAADTIDAWIMSLIQEKRKIINASLDGEGQKQTQNTSIVADLVDKLKSAATPTM